MRANKSLIIYHGNCIDGFTAAWALARSGKPWNEAELFPAKYGGELPDVRGRDVVMVDFCVPRDRLLGLEKQASTFMVFDHHETAQEACQGLDFCIFDMERSGAGLAWDFSMGVPRHWLIDAVEDRDLWRFNLDMTKEIHAYLATQEQTLDAWDRIAACGASDIAALGAGALAYLDAYVRNMRSRWSYRMIAGYMAPCVNAPYMGISELVGAIAEDNPECPFAMGWSMESHGRFAYSLRSRGDFDVSAIATLFGGGGHKNAAGFSAPEPPWQLPLISARPFARQLLGTLDDTSREFKHRLAEVRRMIELEAGVNPSDVELDSGS